MVDFVTWWLIVGLVLASINYVVFYDVNGGNSPHITRFFSWIVLWPAIPFVWFCKAVGWV